MTYTSLWCHSQKHPSELASLHFALHSSRSWENHATWHPTVHGTVPQPPALEFFKIRIGTEFTLEQISKFSINVKGQIKSKWIYEIINFQKMIQQIWTIFALRILIVHRAEILQIFWVIFWKIDDFINPFWLNLTISSIPS